MHGSRFRRCGGVLAGLAVTALVVTTAPVAEAATAPALELPFTCGSSWTGNSGGSSAHRNHEIDFNKTGTSGNEDLGQPVLAAAAGTVRWEGGATSDYGNYLEIDHGDGYSTLYAHLNSKAVHNGDTVRQGQLIGAVGNTDGNAPGITAHLHFEFRNRGSGEGYPDYIRPATFHGDPFDYATGVETYTSQNCGARAAKSINGDKYDDALGIDPDGVAFVYHGQAGGGFADNTRLAAGWSGFSSVGIGDSNADGWADLWAIKAGTLYYWNNNQHGAFSTAVAVGPGWSALEYVAFGDFTGDGRTDILARDGGHMYLYPGTGNGHFATRTFLGEGWAALPRHVVADADGDGDGDIWATSTAGDLFFWRGSGSGNATAVDVGSGWTAYRQVTAMDVNGDNRADLVAIKAADNTLWQWLGTGTGTFGQGQSIGHGWTGYTLAAN